MREKSQIILNNGQCFVLYESLANLINSKVEMPVSLGYYLISNFNDLKQTYETINMTREKIIKGSSDEDGIIPQHLIEEVNDKLNQLGKMETVVRLYKIPIEEMEEAKLDLFTINGLFPILQG